MLKNRVLNEKSLQIPQEMFESIIKRSEIPSNQNLESFEKSNERQRIISDLISKSWLNTLEGHRKMRLKAKTDRQEKQEEEQKKLDEMERKILLNEKKKSLDLAEHKKLRQTPEAREIDRAFILEDVIQDRNLQMREQLQLKENEKIAQISDANIASKLAEKYEEDLIKQKEKLREKNLKYKNELLDQINSNKLNKSKKDPNESNNIIQFKEHNNSNFKKECKSVSEFNRKMAANTKNENERELKYSAEDDKSILDKMQSMQRWGKTLCSEKLQVRQNMTEKVKENLQKYTKDNKNGSKVEKSSEYFANKLIEADLKRIEISKNNDSRIKSECLRISKNKDSDSSLKRYENSQIKEILDKNTEIEKESARIAHKNKIKDCQIYTKILDKQIEDQKKLKEKLKTNESRQTERFKKEFNEKNQQIKAYLEKTKEDSQKYLMDGLIISKLGEDFQNSLFQNE